MCEESKRRAVAPFLCKLRSPQPTIWLCGLSRRDAQHCTVLTPPFLETCFRLHCYRGLANIEKALRTTGDMMEQIEASRELQHYIDLGLPRCGTMEAIEGAFEHTNDGGGGEAGEEEDGLLDEDEGGSDNAAGSSPPPAAASIVALRESDERDVERVQEYVTHSFLLSLPLFLSSMRDVKRPWRGKKSRGNDSKKKKWQTDIAATPCFDRSL